MNNQDHAENATNWKSRTLLVGTVIGALVGAGAAYLLVQKADREQAELKISPGDGVKLGFLVFGLLRQIAQLGDGN